MMSLDVMKKVNYKTDKELVKLITSQAGPMIDWVSDNYNIPFSVDTSWKGLGHSVQRLHAPPEKSGEHLLGRLLQATEKQGVTLITGANVKSLFSDDSGFSFFSIICDISVEGSDDSPPPIKIPIPKPAPRRTIPPTIIKINFIGLFSHFLDYFLQPSLLLNEILFYLCLYINIMITNYSFFIFN